MELIKQSGNEETLRSQLINFVENLNKEIEAGQGPLSDSYKILKINHMYDILQKWERQMANVSIVADRLTALRQFHQQSATLYTDVKRVDNEQNKITNLLSTNAVQLEQVKQSLNVNMQTIAQNISTLGKRIDALQQQRNTNVQ